MPDAARIFQAVDRAARRAGCTSASVDAACYVLRIDFRLTFERIAEQLSLPDRGRVLQGINRTSLALIRKDAGICRLINAARDDLKENTQ